MKKRILTGIALAGAAVLSVGLTGCGAGATRQGESVTKDSLLEKALDTFTKMKSMDADISTNMEVKMGAMGITMEMKNDTEINAVGTKEGESHIKGKSHVSAFGQEREIGIESYTEKEGNELTQYYRMGEGSNEGSWSYIKATADTADTLSEMSVAQVAVIYNKLKDGFSDLVLHDETVSYNNVNCYLMDGMIKGERVAEIMSSSGQEVDEASLENMKLMDVETQLYFRANDETPYALEMDLGKALENVVAAQYEQMQGMEIEAEEMKVCVVFNSFDSVDEVKVPDSVKSSAVEGVSVPDLQSIIGISGV